MLYSSQISQEANHPHRGDKADSLTSKRVDVKVKFR